MKKILITGASGYIGCQLIDHLRKGSDRVEIIATDLRERDFGSTGQAVSFYPANLATAEVADLIRVHRPQIVVHLAAIVSAIKGMTRDFIYDVEVNGTRRVLEACVANGVQKFIVTSSGAAYGYHADQPGWLKESDPLRGNREFAYAWHKRVIEEMLAEYRRDHPALQQLILRVSTILGDNTQNDITNLFHKPRVLGMKGTETPFVIIWDQDLVRILRQGIFTDVAGIFNVAGDGIITLREMAGMIGKPFIELPPGLIRAALAVAHPLKLSRYGPEQVKFLLYRPVLDNTRLKSEFPYTPQKNSKETFLYYAQKNDLL